MREGVATASLFFATLLSGTILPLAKMNKNILRRDRACTGWIGFTNLTGITNELSSKFLCLNRITEVFQIQNGRKVQNGFKVLSSICTAQFILFCFKGPENIFPQSASCCEWWRSEMKTKCSCQSWKSFAYFVWKVSVFVGFVRALLTGFRRGRAQKEEGDVTYFCVPIRI